MFFSCKKTEETTIDPLTGLTKLQEGYAIGASTKVELWGKKNFYVGYNNIVVVLYDSLNLKEKITDAHIRFLPQMTMKMGEMTKKHACPIENPQETAENDVFRGAIVFTMASDANGSWKLAVLVHHHKYDKEGEIVFDVNVENPDAAVLKMFTTQDADSARLILSMAEPSVPKIGMNDIEFTIHKMKDMMSFPPDDSYTIEIKPEMPTMGHGSPNNVNPVNIGNGHYKGKVNFTMTGTWRIYLTIKKNGNVIAENIFFDITF